MDIKKLKGMQFIEIRNKFDKAELYFQNIENDGIYRIYILTLDGFIFKNIPLSLDKFIKNIYIGDISGFCCISNLRNLNKNINDYKTITIEMEESTQDNPIELVGAIKSYKIYKNGFLNKLKNLWK